MSRPLSLTRVSLVEAAVWTGIWSPVGWLYGHHLHTHAWEVLGALATIFGLLGGLLAGLLTIAWTIRRGPPGFPAAAGLGALAANMVGWGVIYSLSRVLLPPPLVVAGLAFVGALNSVLAMFMRRCLNSRVKG